jgi:hypothetical protein
MKILWSWLPSAWEIEEAGAIQALARGEAEPHQQKIALDFIITKVADINGPSLYGNGELDSAHHEGRRYVGNTIVKMLKLNLDTLKRKDK